MSDHWLRPIICSAVLALSAGVFVSAKNMSNHHTHYLLYVGTYGDGVYGFRYDSATGSLQSLGLMGEVKNPSWITADSHFKFLYAASELEGNQKGGIVGFSIDRKSGKLTKLNSQSSDGIAPCHVAVDKTGKVLVAANYTSGSAASFPLGTDGEIGPLASLMTASGTGPNSARQEGPHFHEAVISHDNKFVYVPDLGLDTVHIYKLDTATAKLTENDPPGVKLAPGVGPRHIIFSPNDKFAYVVSELKPDVMVFTHDAANGGLEQIQTIPTAEHLPADGGPAEILITQDGKYIYASNRGPGTIAVFSADPSTGKLRPVETAETGFTWPRGVQLDPTGNLLFAGCQKDQKFVTFRIDHSTGKLTLMGSPYQVPSPVAFLFVPVD